MRQTEMFVILNLVTFILPVSITVARLDVTFFSLQATPGLNSADYYIGGYSGGDTISTVGTRFSYGRILNTGTGSDLPSGINYETYKEYTERLYLPTGAGRPGVYYCDANTNTGKTERLQTVLVANEALVKPERPTKTISWGDDVVLKMTTSLPEASLKWRHNGIQKSEWNGQSSITISFAKPSDAGIYECYSSETQRSQGKHGFMRLIVRDCPNGKWHLPYCLSSCPTCHNGGICNSHNGECICPPGFMGNHCETGCGKNLWGMTCDRTCAKYDEDACRSTLFCLADPYGCSCITSYGGPECADDCPSGLYGPWCSQKCNCKNGCDSETGECNPGNPLCEIGWNGSKCNIPDSCPDGFYGELCNYNCHCKNNAACNRTTGKCSNGECASGWIDVDLSDCQQDGSTKVSSIRNIQVNPGEQSTIICEAIGNPIVRPSEIWLQEKSGLQFSMTSHHIDQKYIFIGNFSGVTVNHEMTFTCNVSNGDSLELINLELYALPRLAQAMAPQVKANKATVTWRRWTAENDIGNGPVDVYTVYYKQSESDVWNLHRSFNVEDPDQVTYSSVITGLHWSSTYDFTVTVKRPGPMGEGSKETVTSATTLCDVPSEAPTIKSSSSRRNEIEIEIEVPSPSSIKCNYNNNNGYIESFSTKYRKAYSSDNYIEISEAGRSRSFLVISGLEPYTEYEIIISFHNKDEQSPWSLPHITSTAEGVPGMPSSLSVTGVTTNSITITWTESSVFTGDIIGYGVSYRSIDSVFSNMKIHSDAMFVGKVKTFRLDTLRQGVQYEVSVNASTSFGSGEPITILTGTTFEVDIPRTLPMSEELNKPVVLSDSNAVVNLPGLAPDTKISRDTTLIDYIVVVENVRNNNGRKRRRVLDTNMLKAYNRSDVPYIAALFILEDMPSIFTIGSGGLYGGYFNAPLEIGRQYNIYYGLASLYTGELVCYLDEQTSLIFLARKLASNDERTPHTVYIVGGALAVVLAVFVIGCLVSVFRRLRSRQRKMNKARDEIELNEVGQRDVGKRNFGIEQDTEHQAKRNVADKNTDYAVISTIASSSRKVKKSEGDNVYTDLQLDTRIESTYASLSPTSVVSNTAISVEDIAKVFDNLLKKDRLKTRLELEWQRLNEMSYKPKPEECQMGRLPQNIAKNRSKDILPFDKHCPHLSSLVRGKNETDYINASFLDSYIKKNAFLVTQIPLSTTVADFLRMVCDHKSRIIVMLNAEDGNSSYLPPHHDVRHCGSFVLESVSMKSEGNVTERKLRLSKGKESVLIHHFQIHGWRRNTANRDLAKEIVGLMTKIEEARKKNDNGPITMHCINGIDQSGVFCATLYACEQIKVDQVVDVFNAVRSLRNNRPRMVETLEQYRLCYEVMKLYCETNILSYYNLKNG